MGAITAGRFGAKVIRNAKTSIAARLAFAFGGGLLMGLAARAARGCTSGQALSRGAVPPAGPGPLMLPVFPCGFGFGRFLWGEWS